jgi:fido (protein-threonine AMPylation protein)
VSAADPYVYPGTSVLRNTQDRRDAARLRQVESDLIAAHALRLARALIAGVTGAPASPSTAS